MGYHIFMDHNADAEGNYTLVAYDTKQDGKLRHSAGLYPFGTFLLDQNTSGLPPLRLERPLVWPRGRPPLAVPICGFRGELCVQQYADNEIVMGVVGGISIVLCVVMIVAYRNYKYEQELDSLLWRVDPKDLKV